VTGYWFLTNNGASEKILCHGRFVFYFRKAIF